MSQAAAVEAAARALWELDRDATTKTYEDCREGTKRHLRREASVILEAVKPYITGGPWTSVDEDRARSERSYFARNTAASVRSEADDWVAHLTQLAKPLGLDNGGVRDYVDRVYKVRAAAWDEGFTACAHQHMQQQEDPTHPITRTNPYEAAQ